MSALFRVFVTAAILVVTSSNQPCSNVMPELQLPCQCSKSEAGDIGVNCDYVVFQKFPVLPFRSRISEYRQRHAGIQALESQLFTAAKIPLKKVDFSHNGLWKLNGRVFEGVEDSVEALMLQHNLLGEAHSRALVLPEIAKLTALKTLNLAHNRIQELAPPALRSLTNLQVLQLEGNLLTDVPTDQLSRLSALKVLTLQENDIGFVNEGAFHATPSLVFLNASHNQISSTADGAFSHLANLTALDLAYNRLETVPSEAFRGLVSLEDLDLSSNFFIEIPANAFRGLDSLKSLQMQNNRIQTLGGIVALGPSSSLNLLDLTRNSIVNLESKTFKRLTSLKTLKLSVNSVGKRKTDAFEGLETLEVLELDDHRFFSFPSSMLSQTPSLKSLSLNYNRIRVITRNSLQVVTQLSKLSLANNIIREIFDNTFQNFTDLAILNLSGNKVSKLNKETFATVANTLQYLDLSFNLLSELPEFDLPQLSRLNVAGNKLTFLVPKAFFYLPELQQLELSHNKFATLPLDLFAPLSRLGTLDLSYNKLNKIQSGQFNGTVINVINVKGNRIREIDTNAFENLLLLTSLDASDNKIEIIQEGAFHDTTFLHILNLKNNMLTSFNENIFSFPRTQRTQLRYLDLSDNNITFLRGNAFEPHPRIIWLSLANNRLTFFPPSALKTMGKLTQLNLSGNELESIDSPDFAESRSLRELDLSHNRISELSEKTFQNSTQLQNLDLSHNQIKELLPNQFLGISQLSLDLSHNKLISFPDDLYDNTKMKLLFLNLAYNQFPRVPAKALRSQYASLNHLNMAHNNVSNIPNNADILVNVRSLDLSYNSLTQNDILELLNEPKVLKEINLAGTDMKEIPLIETRFLTSLNLSNNEIDEVTDESFKLTHDLRTLDLSNNHISNSDSTLAAVWQQLPNLRYLDLSENSIEVISGEEFQDLKHLEVLRAAHLPRLAKINEAAFDGLKLREFYLFDIPMVKNVNIGKVVDTMPGLEKVDVELKSSTVDEQLQGAFSPRLQMLTIRGDKVTAVESSAFLNLNSPKFELGILDTNVTQLSDRILFLVPMSSDIVLSINGSHIESLSPKFLEDVALPRKGRLRIAGLGSNPLLCDCRLIALQEWLQSVDDPALKSALCAGPPSLMGQRIVDLAPSQLECIERKKSTNNNLSDIITKDELDEKVKKSEESTQPGHDPEEHPKSVKFTGMDKIIIGVVGGVILFVAVLILIVCLFRVLCDRRRRNTHPHPHMHAHSNCTCLKPPIPPMGYSGPYSLPPPPPGSRMGTLKSMPPTTPIPPTYGTLGAQSRGSYYSGPPSYMGMYPQDEHDYR